LRKSSIEIMSNPYVGEERDEMKIAEAARQKKRANRLDFGAVFHITSNYYY